MKLAIIGAGPGGLHAALTAARQGHQVDLIEKGQVGEGIVCGECIFDALNILPKPGTGLLHPVKEMLLQAHGTYRLPIGHYRKLWMMDRSTWQQDLARQAAALGVVLSEGRKISPEILKTLQNTYDWIIDASGAPSVTSRLYGFSRDYFPGALIAYQVVVAGDFSALTPAIKTVFLPHLPKEAMPGYAWIFPKGTTRANVGVVCTAREDGRLEVDLKGLLAEVLRQEGLHDRPIEQKGGGLIPGHMLPRLLYDNILLVGDAAGLASPLHGGGIDLACWSGILAVSALNEGEASVNSYRQRLANGLREKWALENLMVKKMRSLSFDDLDALFQAAALPKASIRAKATWRHPDLLYAAWKWLKSKGHPLIPASRK